MALRWWLRHTPGDERKTWRWRERAKYMQPPASERERMVCACVGINKEALSRGPFRQPTITTFASNARVRVSKFIETRLGHKRLRVAQKLFTLWIFIQVPANLLPLMIPIMDIWCVRPVKHCYILKAVVKFIRNWYILNLMWSI